MTNVARSDAGIPFLRKSLAVMKRWPSLFSCVILPSAMSNTHAVASTHAVMLGKPETGRPIPAEQMRAVAMISRRGCGSGSELPMRSAMGTRRTAAMVCEMLSS